MESSDGDFKFPAHSLHRLPQLPSRISSGLRNRYRHPRGQAASAVSGLEGVGPVRDLPEPAQGVWRLRQVNVPGDIGRLQRGPSSLSASPDILGAVDDGGKGGRLLRSSVSGSSWRALSHHIQCDG